MKQGDVYWCEFDPPDKPRPVVILTGNASIAVLTSVTVAPVTTSLRDLPSRVRLAPPVGGLFEVSDVNANYIQTIPKRRLSRQLGELSPAHMSELARAISFALALGEMGAP